MKSTVVKYSAVLSGHKTSVSLEAAFWTALKEISEERRMTLSQVVTEVDATRQQGSNLSSAVRLFALDHYKGRAADQSKRTIPFL